MRKLNVYDWYFIAIAIVFAVAYPVVLFMLPVAVDSTVPTLVNGITTSMSIIIGLGGAVIGIVFRGDIEKGDSKARRIYFYALSLLIIPLIYPWGSYISLAAGTSWYVFAVRYSLDGYLVALLAIMIVYLLTARRWYLEKEEKTESDKPESAKTAQEKKKPEEAETTDVNRRQTEDLKMSGNRRIRRNKDSDLLKIQILADYYQASFSFSGSLVSGILIGLFVVAITLRLESVLSDISYYVFLGLILIFFLSYGTRTYRSYHSDLEKIDNLFIRVQNGETLPSITELRKMKNVYSVKELHEGLKEVKTS
jgi:hypothetical protein